MPEEKFFVEDPCQLFAHLYIFPTQSMTIDEKLNALTRLAIIISLIMFALDYNHWFTFLILSLLFIVLIKYVGKKNSAGKESFSIVPTYDSTDFQTTIVSPLFSEEWQIPPPAYDLYTQVPYGKNDTFDEPMKPSSYPYGQYLTRTNLLPSDEYYTHLQCGGPSQAREYYNSAFLRQRLANQENMTRLYKKKLERRYRNSCNDSFSPFSSY